MRRTAPDPFRRIQQWHDAAARAGEKQPNAMCIATVGADGMPSLRYVLLKSLSPAGLVFFTDSRSRKGVELARSPKIAATLRWGATGRQIRVEGMAQPLPAAVADEYWSTRPRVSRLSAAASIQSAPLRARELLVARRDALAQRYARHGIPRPPAWLGYVIEPCSIEFWTQKRGRLHHRELFSRTTRGWRIQLLQP